jgi:hypothetical protein
VPRAPGVRPSPMTDVRDQLQMTLGAAYTLQRELGGGGMSRVFVAREEARFRRRVHAGRRRATFIGAPGRTDVSKRR